MDPLVELPHLLRLLDDDDPAVREPVALRLRNFAGDLSEPIAALGIDLSAAEQERLADLLLPARRRELVSDWIVPSGGWPALADDWDRVEALLRLVADFLHDGVNLRPSLHDALDLLAEEFEASDHPLTVDDLRQFLFSSGRLVGNKSDYYNPRNSDLCWAIENGRSNPLGLSLIFILVGRRLNLPVEACNFPGHFLCRIDTAEATAIVDCFNGGRLHSLDEMLAPELKLSLAAQKTLETPATAGEVLMRTLRNLEHSFARLDQAEDQDVFRKLRKSLEPRNSA
jgi:regulator of sirC expression with transglutaminase-like and TPR domain